MTQRLVVVGGDAAGMSAASRARRLAPELEIIVLEQGAHISYAACGMPLLVAGTVSEAEQLVVLTPEAAREKRGLDLRLGHRVRTLDLAGRTVTGERVDSGESFSVGYDRLLLATGARPVRPPVPGADAEGVFVLRRLEHGQALRAFVDERRPRKAVVVGAGYVGLDVSEALRERDVAVTLLKHRDHPLLGLEPELSALVEEALVRAGCVLLRNAPLYRVETGDDGRAVAVQAGGERLEADLVVLATGVRPASGLAERAGLTLGPQGAIQVDARTQTSDPAVQAAGDCATQHHRVSGQPVFLSQALAANRQGRVAGAQAALSLLGRPQEAPRHPGTLGTTLKKVFDQEVGHTGLTLAEARHAGFEAFATTTTGTNRAGYHPGAGPVKVTLVAERSSGRLLGGQVAGAPGAAKRVDVIAVALAAGFDLATLADQDLGYAPPFSPVWDPVLIAARVADKKRSG